MLKTNNFTKFITNAGLMSSIGAVLAACNLATVSPGSQYFASQPVAGSGLAPAPLPTINPGDKFYYANGWREQVVSTDGETVTLINKSKRKVVNFRNFAIPSPYLEGREAEYFKETRTQTNVLWPLKIGNTARFSTDGTSKSKISPRVSEYSQKWECEVEGTEHVRVLAGEFDTFRVSCKRRSSSNKWWQTYTWYYAPILNTYVMRRSFHKKNGERIRELTALRPSLTNEPKRVRSGIIRTWQDTLENAKSGDIRSWTDKKTGTSVQVEPLATYRAQNGQFCRTYKQYLTRNNIPRLYAGVACRTGKLKWRTPTKG